MYVLLDRAEIVDVGVLLNGSYFLVKDIVYNNMILKY